MPVLDYRGEPWEVREVRPTAHGFDLYLGRKSMSHLGGAKVIPTRELVEYLRAHAGRRGAIDLPLSGGSLARLRAELGLSGRDAGLAWWLERLEDLRTLSFREFARRHGLTPSAACLAARRLGESRVRGRPMGWWRQEPARGLLEGPESDARVAAKLGVSRPSVHRYRSILRREAPDSQK